MINPPLFRQKAMERISSPEQFDKMVRVTLPRRWVALLGILLALTVVLVWAFVASVSTTISGPGYFLPQGGLRDVTAPASGLVGKLELSRGQHVVAGEQVGTISRLGGAPIPVSAAATGVIAQVNAAVGDYVYAGNSLAQIVPVGWPMVVYAYLPVEEAAGLLPGTAVHVNFGSGVGSAFGFVKGSVLTSSQFPVTESHLRSILRVSSVIASIEKLGPVGEVVVALDETGTTKSGLEWGVGKGPPGVLPAGLTATVTFIVGSHHPINDVF